MPRVSRSGGPVLRERGDRVHRRRADVEGKDTLGKWRLLAAEVRPRRQQPFVRRVLDPEAR